MSAGDEGLVYELHFDEPIGDPENPKGQAQHYIGHALDLDRRLAEHRGGHTAAILRAVNEAGIGWHLVRTWPGTRDTERQIKLLRSGRRLCPECTEHPLTGAGAVARAAALRQEREAARAAVPEPPRPAPVPPYEAGREMGRQFMAQQHAAGRTAAQIEAAHYYITGPWHEMGHHTEDQAERFRGYTDLITAALGLIREAEAEGPHHEMEAGTGPAGPAGNEMEEQMQGYDADGNAATGGGVLGHGPSMKAGAGRFKWPGSEPAAPAAGHRDAWLSRRSLPRPSSAPAASCAAATPREPYGAQPRPDPSGRPGPVWPAGARSPVATPGGRYAESPHLPGSDRRAQFRRAGTADVIHRPLRWLARIRGRGCRGRRRRRDC